MIEIMLVLALIGLIMGAIVIGSRRKTRDAQVQIAKLGVQQLSGLFFNHRLANSGECPSIKKWLEDKPLKSEPKDPWGHPLVIICPGEHDEGSADIISPGLDGEAGNQDDIESWKLE